METFASPDTGDRDSPAGQKPRPEQSVVLVQPGFWQKIFSKPGQPWLKSIAGFKIVFRAKTLLIKVGQGIRRHRVMIVIFAGSTLTGSILIFAASMLFLPQSIQYAFASQQNCIRSPEVFPNLLKVDSPGAFTLNRASTISIGHTAIFSYRLCAVPARDPLSSATYVGHQWVPLGNLHVGKSLKVVTAAYPSVSITTLGAKAVPLEKPLLFGLNLPDATFDYAVTANGQTGTCSKQQTTLSCSLAPLKLAYATSYKLALVRVFHGQMAGTVLSQSLQTITATAITQTSISSGTTVYDNPQQITINTDKGITGLQSVGLTMKNADGSSTTVPITSSYSGKTITVTIVNPLARAASFDLRIGNVTADDQSTLEQPYDLVFMTSTGPKVSAVNIPTFGLSSNQTIVVSFDQVLNPNQDPSQFASLLVSGNKQPASISLSGSQLSIKPTTSFPICAGVSIQLTAAAQNAYGISGGSAWSYASRAHCYTTFSIGNSVQGRPITAYQFGSGASMILYIGAMEGNEQNSMVLLQKWIPELDAHPENIPSWHTIVVIPAINPDGVAANTRLNADGIDLNRNFPANDWQTQVTEPLANTVWTNDGGPSPLSEPESQALANYELAHRPRLVLTMHSHAGLVEANDAGDSIALGATYAAKAGYQAIPTYAIGNIFDYTTTGAFEDWVNDKLGLPVLEVELESPTADEFSQNLPALWAMAQISP